MSVQALAWVLEESEATHGARLVLIAIANHHNKETGASFPGYDLLAREARLSRSATIRAVEQLEHEGRLVVERPGTAGRGRSNRYYIVGFDKTVASRDQSVMVASEPEMVASEPLNGRASATRSIGTVEPWREKLEAEGGAVSPPLDLTSLLYMPKRDEMTDDERDPAKVRALRAASHPPERGAQLPDVGGTPGGDAQESEWGATRSATAAQGDR